MKTLFLLATVVLFPAAAEARPNHCAAAARIFGADPAFLDKLYEITDAGKPRFLLFGLALGARGVDVRRDGHTILISRERIEGEFAVTDTTRLVTDAGGRLLHLASLQRRARGATAEMHTTELTFSHGTGRCVLEDALARRKSVSAQGHVSRVVEARHNRARCVAAHVDCHETILDELAADSAGTNGAQEEDADRDPAPASSGSAL